MGGFFGTVAKATSCVADLFYGTDYNSHLGTKRGGLATYDAETEQFTRSIHNLESTYFRTKFEDELDKFKGNSGIGIISDTDPQPLILNSARTGNKTVGPKHAFRRTQFGQNQSDGTYRPPYYTRKDICRRN